VQNSLNITIVPGDMDYPLTEARKDITSKLKNVLVQLKYKYEPKIKIPSEELGDFAFPCFTLAAVIKKSPEEISEEIASRIKKGRWIKKVKTTKGYVNFFIDKQLLISSTLKSIENKKEDYGNLKRKNKKVIIEHTSANPNGPLHVGRARNPIIGDTLVRIFKAAGFDVESQFYLDDMGKQVAILTWGIGNLCPKDFQVSKYNKSDHKNVGFYQIANKLMKDDEKISKEISNIIKNSERGDIKTIERIHKAYSPVLKGINESLQRINITIDRYIPESDFVKNKSVDIVVDKLKKSKYCGNENGGYYLDIESFGIHGRNTRFFFTRSDGTTLYATRDIAYHLWKGKHADILINILGEDHKLESKQVEIALNLLEVKTIPKPIFYAFVSMPGGKMSTRYGRVVYLDDLIEECVKRAYEEVKIRRGMELSEGKMRAISEIIGIGSLRYNIIKVQPEKDIIFKWEDALNFEGNAAPFIQYAHARSCGILSKIGKKWDFKDPNYLLLEHDSEYDLVKKLAKFPIVIDDASKGFKPHIIASYLFDTASQFNQFYRDCYVLSEKNPDLKKARLALVNSTRIVLKNGLNLLGIIAPVEM
jgi:arginyl-tRNA synthetase